MARKRTLAAALAMVGYLQVAPAWSLGLGEITLESFLNEPLEARVRLLNTGNLHEDQIRIRLATSDDFDRLGVERSYFLTGIKYQVELDQEGNGVILLSSEDPVLEPYLDFIIEARWPAGRLLRNYTVLVDPPGRLPESRSVSASEKVADREAEKEAEEEAGTEATSETPAEQVSGDQVDLRSSDLAPGDMPRRPYSSDTAPTPAPGGRYLVRRDETLWAIAQEARPEGVSVQQTMLEIQRLNPDAFIDGNINRIKAGYIIYLPDSGDMSPADIETVREQVRQQNADWRAGRPSTPAAPQPALRIASDSGDADADADGASDTAPDSAAGREESATDNQAAVVQRPAATDSMPSEETREDLQRAEQERDELSRQLSSLNDRLASLERMVELRDAEIAELQAALAEAQSRPAAPATPVAAAADSEPRPPEPPSGETGSGDGSGWWYALGAALLVALVGLFVWRRRQEQEDELGAAAPGLSTARDDFSTVELQDQAVELDMADADQGAVEAPPPPRAPTGPQRGYGERKHDQYAADMEASDALAEADIYIAYGRFPQAVELLHKAAAAEPDNSAYRLRLLELAVETDDREEAEEQLAELRRIGDAESIEAAENLFLGGAVFGNREPEAASPEDSERDLAPDPLDQVAEAMPEVAATDKAAAGGSPKTEAWASPGSDEEFSGHLSDFGQVEPVGDLSDDIPDLSAAPGDSRDERVPAAADEEPEFLGLEIEEPPEEELDLSQDASGTAGGHASDEDEFVFADDGDPLATKLDLARAYIDMGDEQGAREILNEVLSEGSGEQQQDARELLERLG